MKKKVILIAAVASLILLATNIAHNVLEPRWYCLCGGSD